MLHRTNPTCKETGVKEVKGSLQQRSQLFANLMAGRSDGEAMKPDIIYGKGKGAEKKLFAIKRNPKRPPTATVQNLDLDIGK